MGIIKQSINLLKNRIQYVQARSVSVNISQIPEGEGWAGKVDDEPVAIISDCRPQNHHRFITHVSKTALDYAHLLAP